MSSKQFQVGDVVRHNQRGVGQVVVSADTIRVKYASGQSSPSMQQAEAAQLLTKLPDDSPEALLLEHPESLQPWVEEAPIKLVATAVSVNGNSANASSIERLLFPVFNDTPANAQWDDWSREVLPYAKKSDDLEFIDKGKVFSLAKSLSDIAEAPLPKPVKVKDWADWLKSPLGRAPARPQLPDGLLRNTISVVQGETWPPDFPLTLASELASELEQSGGNDSRNFLKALYQLLGRSVRVSLSLELANCIFSSEGFSAKPEDALDLLLAGSNQNERNKVLQNLAVQASEGHLPPVVIGNYLADAVADVQDPILRKTTRQFQDALSAPDAVQVSVELLFEIQNRLADLKRQNTKQTTAHQNQLKSRDSAHQKELKHQRDEYEHKLSQQSAEHQKELKRQRNEHERKLSRQAAEHQEALKSQFARLSSEHGKELQEQSDSHEEKLRKQESKHQSVIAEITEQFADFRSDAERKREESRFEIRKDMLLVIGDTLRSLSTNDAGDAAGLRDGLAGLKLALRAGGGELVGAVGETVAFNPVCHQSNTTMAAGTPARVDVPGVVVRSGSAGEQVLFMAKVSSLQEAN